MTSLGNLTLNDLWNDVKFTPNSNQRDAILHVNNPLFLTAGPGSGKTRVILWRTLNLIVFHDIKPEEIFLSTFTEKAAFQLKQGLRSLLGLVTNRTNKPYDISKMYVGTVHALCRQMIMDRRFAPNRSRSKLPSILDDLGQYFYFSTKKKLKLLMSVAGIEDIETINKFFDEKRPSASRHQAIMNCITLFNRLSEECIDPDKVASRITDDTLKLLMEMYASYRVKLSLANEYPETDFSLLQQYALGLLSQNTESQKVFKHVIIDEYQDTNTVQERLFFKLASGHNNICVVGDDDQALYRFRGATVENFVQFPQRCQQYLSISPKTIPLSTNYRSRQQIVQFYTNFIEECDWQTVDKQGYYRVVNKQIQANNSDNNTSVVVSSNTSPDVVYNEIVQLVKQLINSGKVQDPNQIAFLFPSIRNSKPVDLMKEALENEGFLVYAPRASRFLEVDEAKQIFGLFLGIFGKPEKGDFTGRDYDDFHRWMDDCLSIARGICKKDKQLVQYVKDRKAEIEMIKNDYNLLVATVNKYNWSFGEPYNIDLMKRKLAETPGLSEAARKNLVSSYFDKFVKLRIEEGNPFKLSYVLDRATSLDWNVLDLFYRLVGFEQFKKMFDLAESGKDEGPICNLGLISQYLARFMEEYSSMINAWFVREGYFQRSFFLSFLYSLYRLGEGEYEDANDPFPKGRIPFLTIHQAKGLEFPVVVLGSLRKDNRPQFLETIIRPLIDRPGEPLERSGEFDSMRMFYVALSRAKNLLVIANPKGQGIVTHKAFKNVLDGSITKIRDLDINSVPVASIDIDELGQTYSYTGDYLVFQKCPRQYMIFRKYGFVPSRSQIQFFGSLVHQTIEDLHHLLIAQKGQP